MSTSTPTHTRNAYGTEESVEDYSFDLGYELSVLRSTAVVAKQDLRNPYLTLKLLKKVVSVVDMLTSVDMEVDAAASYVNGRLRAILIKAIGVQKTNEVIEEALNRRALPATVQDRVRSMMESVPCQEGLKHQ